MTQNLQDQNTTGGTLYYSTNYTSSQTYPTLTSSNYATVAADVESKNTFEKVLNFQSFVINHTQDNEQTTEVDDCGVGVIRRSSVFTPNLGFDFLNVDDIDLFARVLGLQVQNVAGTAVSGATQDVVNPSAYNEFIKLSLPARSSSVTVNSITGSTDGALVAGTDYVVIQNERGEDGFYLVSGGAITTLTQTFTVNYDYTPNTSRLVGYNVAARDVPFNLFKFVTCPNSNGEINTYYMVKYSLSSDYTYNFDNLTRDGVSQTFSSVEFAAEKGGSYIENKQTLTEITV